jgi:hypothetical protein
MIIFLSVVDIFVLVVALLTYYKMKIEIEDLHGKISILHKRISTENAFLRMRVVDFEDELIQIKKVYNEQGCTIEKALKQVINDLNLLDKRLIKLESRPLRKENKVRSVKKS